MDTRRIILLVTVTILSIISVLLPYWAAQRYATVTVTASNLDDVLSTLT